jgi:hypothetical protein
VEDIDMEQFTRIATYIRSLDKILMANEVRAFNAGMVNDMNAQSAAMSGQLQKPTTPKNGVGMAGPNQVNNNPVI